MRHAISTLAVQSLLAAVPAVRAADQEPAPEISRAAASPQANGQAHTLRTIPEACLRLQGEFTGDPAAPLPLPAGAHQRRLPGPGAGGRRAQGRRARRRLDPQRRIRVPAPRAPASRPWSRLAPGREAKAPALDAQGKSRIYLEEGWTGRRRAAGGLAGVRGGDVVAG